MQTPSVISQFSLPGLVRSSIVCGSRRSESGTFFASALVNNTPVVIILIPVVRQIARDNNVTVLHQGSVLCEGKFDEVQSNQKVREVYLGRGKHGNR